MKCVMNRRWLVVMSLTGLSVVSGVWLRASLAQTPETRAKQTGVVQVVVPASPGLQPPGASPYQFLAGPVMPPQPVAFYGATPACAEQAEQDAEVRKLVTEYHATQDENRRARIEKELPALIAKEFDARQEAREQELKQLKEQLQKLQELHVKRSKQKEQIVEERVRQLLRDAEGLGWGSDSEMPMGLSIDPAVGPRHVYSTGTIIGKRP